MHLNFMVTIWTGRCYKCWYIN